MPEKPRIAVILGTRPEAIKLAPVIGALRRCEACTTTVISTAQHRQMLDQVLQVYSIVPDVDLDLMRPDQTLAQLTARALQSLDEVLRRLQPELVLVQGDTTTVLAAALACFYLHVPVGHVEAGLRTGNMNSPWPEEANRVLATRLATLHFAPTARARGNLLAEGIADDRIWQTGNTVVDALVEASARVRERAPEVPGLSEQLLSQDRRLVLVTGHRRESFGRGFAEICAALRDLALARPDVDIVYPVHLNPNVQEPVRHSLCDLENVHLISPVAYLPFVRLLGRATLVLTDSGGIQEEAPSLGKPVLVMRDTTERPEAIEAGIAELVGTDRKRICERALSLLADPDRERRVVERGNPFGDGHAADRIVAASLSFLGTRA